MTAQIVLDPSAIPAAEFTFDMYLCAIKVGITICNLQVRESSENAVVVTHLTETWRPHRNNAAGMGQNPIAVLRLGEPGLELTGTTG